MDWSGVGAFLLGLLCFVGIVAYWYFLPYQFWLGLINAGSLIGPVLGYGIMLVITVIFGFVVTLVLAVIGLALWSD